MWLELRAGDWTAPPVRLADSFWQRWKGLRPYPGSGLLLRGSWVHGHGLKVPLTVAALSAEGLVVSVETLRPGGRCMTRGASWMLELPVGEEPPTAGATLEVSLRT